MQTRLSLCVIVQNEEDCILNCIGSVRHLVDEIIVVDTGSTDDTPKLAKEAGASVFSFQWQQDFAAARNFALAQAAGEWILVLDADEVLAQVDGEEFDKLLASAEYDAYYLPVYSYIGAGEGKSEDLVVRLFKNRPEYRFEGAIHEQVAGSIQRNNGRLGRSGFIIWHYGYLDEKILAKDKHERNIGVASKALAQNPDDPFLLYSLGIEYYQSGAKNEGNRLLTKAIRYLSGAEGYYRNVVITLAIGLHAVGDLDSLSALLAQAHGVLPGDPDIALLRGLAAVAGGDRDAAIDNLTSALKSEGEILPLNQIQACLGDCYYSQGRYDRAAESYLAALKIAPVQLYPLTRILACRPLFVTGFHWHDISRFASVQQNFALQESLAQMREWRMAVVLSLLNIINIVSDPVCTGSLLTACKQCEEWLLHYRSVCGIKAAPVLDCLLWGARQMSVEAGGYANRLNCSIYEPLSRIKFLAEAGLDVIADG